MFNYFKQFSSNTHYICCEDSPFLVRWPWPSLSHNCLSKLRNAFTCIVIYVGKYLAMAFKLGMKADLCMWYRLVVVLMTLTLMQGNSGSAEEQIQLWIFLTTKQAIKIKIAATVGHDKFFFSLKSSVPVHSLHSLFSLKLVPGFQFQIWGEGGGLFTIFLILAFRHYNPTPFCRFPASGTPTWL